MHKITLCSYTFNDTNLLSDLLVSVARWSVQPDEIIIVDDCSAEPFVFSQDDLSIPIKIFRNKTNRGPAYSKNFGISQASSDYILSLDCDMRIADDWLERAVDVACSSKNIGIVGAPIESGGADTVSARYESITASYHCTEENIVFLNGSIWLFSKVMWLNVGGFGEYEERTHEDHYFCKKVKQAGYTLYSTLQFPPARQVRKLHYTDLVRRFWIWHKSAFIENLGSTLVRSLLIVNMQNQIVRINHFIKTRQDEFCYIELLYFLNTSLNIIEYSAGKDDKRSEANYSYRCIIFLLYEIRKNYKEIFELIIIDMKYLKCSYMSRLLIDVGSINMVDVDEYFSQELLMETLFEIWNENVLTAIRAKCPLLLAERFSARDFTFYKDIR